MGITEMSDKSIKKEIRSDSAVKNIPQNKPKQKSAEKKFNINILGKDEPAEKNDRKTNDFAPEESSNKTIYTYAGKEIFEKLGSGLVSEQYLNVLLSQIGASYFLIGIFHGLKDMFSIFTSIFLRESLRIRNPDKWMIDIAGILLGASYLTAAIGFYFSEQWIVGIALIIAGVLLTFLGHTYVKSYLLECRQEPRLRALPEYSVTFIGIGLVAAAWIMDRYPLLGGLIYFSPTFGIPGFFLLFSIAAICFIISSQLMKTLIKDERFEIKTSFWFIIKEHLGIIYQKTPKLLKNKVMIIALTASAITGIVQTLGNIYYGIYVYKIFKYIGFGGFMNISMIFIIALLSALMSPTISKLLSKKYGNLPLLTFGTLMIATQPLVYYFSPNLLAISMATMVGIIGASVLGLATGLLITHALKEDEREEYYMIFSFIITVPYIIFVPLGALLAQALGLKLLFLILALTLIFVVAPMYFVLQAILGKKSA